LDSIDAIPNYGYNVMQKDDQVLLKYPLDKYPSVGYGFHHGRFVKNLRNLAEAAENVTTLEATVNSLLYDSTDKVIGVSCTLKNQSSGPVEVRFVPI
jgi:squalene monooxygenase